MRRNFAFRLQWTCLKPEPVTQISSKMVITGFEFWVYKTKAQSPQWTLLVSKHPKKAQLIGTRSSDIDDFFPYRNKTPPGQKIFFQTGINVHRPKHIEDPSFLFT